MNTNVLARLRTSTIRWKRPKTMNYKLAKEMYRIEIKQKYQEANCAKRIIGLINNKEGIRERYSQSHVQSQEQSRGMKMKR